MTKPLFFMQHGWQLVALFCSECTALVKNTGPIMPSVRTMVIATWLHMRSVASEFQVNCNSCTYTIRRRHWVWKAAVLLVERFLTWIWDIIHSGFACDTSGDKTARNAYLTKTHFWLHELSFNSYLFWWPLSSTRSESSLLWLIA